MPVMEPRRREQGLALGAVLLLAAMVPLSASAVKGPVLEGTPGRVVDGDTFSITGGKNVIRVRIADIDAPELDQAFGEAARTALAAMLDSVDTIRIRVIDVDRYSRIVGHVEANGRDVGRVLVARGLAWVYRRYSRDPDLLAAEATARQSARGLWSRADPVPPWRHRKGTEAVAPSENIERPDGCREEVHCGDLSSCEEARFELESCGRSDLDADDDGVPCEALCEASP